MHALPKPVQVTLSYVTTDDFPTEAQVCVPGGYVDVHGWRLTYDPRDDTPWTIWKPEHQGVREAWASRMEYDGALSTLIEAVRSHL
jgi:hypothetical protein